ncbi:MAG: F0F1 ATP synthase subunit gamma [Patescibacteria group bacterium]
MNNNKQMRVEKESLYNLKSLIDVYEEVAATRMQKVREAVLSSRQFLESLLVVFQKVKAAYKIADPMAGTLVRNGKTVAVFVSANAGLYGEIVNKTFELFVKRVQEDPGVSVVVLGKLGVKMMAERIPNVLYNYYDFSDEGVDMDSFDIIMRYLIQFEKLVVFHGQFRSTADQVPVATGVSGDAIQVSEEIKAEATKNLYIFEPSVKDIVRVFEGEILASIFEQTLHESQLSKFASRMLSLDRAMDNIDKRLVNVNMQELRFKHKQKNARQMATISGLSLWNK